MIALAVALRAATVARLPDIDRQLAAERAVLARAETPLLRLTGDMQRLARAAPTAERNERLQHDAALLRLLEPALAVRASRLRREIGRLAADRAELVIADLLRRRGLRPARIAHLRPVAGCAIGAFRPPVDGPALLPRVAAALDQPDGATVVALPGAAVVAPADGRVAYAGSFRRYGGVVILHHGHGWTTLLTGLGEVVAQANTSVIAGEALGSVRGETPLVTLELSRHGRAIDPLAMLRRCPMLTPRRRAVPNGAASPYMGG